jgi:hypothetical protein
LVVFDVVLAGSIARLSSTMVKALSRCSTYVAYSRRM